MSYTLHISYTYILPTSLTYILQTTASRFSASLRGLCHSAFHSTPRGETKNHDAAALWLLQVGNLSSSTLWSPTAA